MGGTSQGTIAVGTRPAEPASGVPGGALPESLDPAAATTAEGAEGHESRPPVEPVQSEQNPAALNFTGGLGSSESWIGAHKYILGAILLIAAGVAAVVWLR